MKHCKRLSIFTAVFLLLNTTLSSTEYLEPNERVGESNICILDGSNFTHWAEILISNKTLTDVIAIDFKNDQIGDLVNALKGHPVLSSLMLTVDELSDDDFHKIGSLLSKTNNLCNISVLSGNLDRKNVVALNLQCEKKILDKLAAAELFFEEIESNISNNGKSLLLNFKKIDDYKLFKLSQFMRRKNSIEDLRLNGNLISAKGAAYISDILDHNEQLKTLSLSSNFLGDGGLKCISPSIGKHGQLKRLVLTGNNLSSNNSDDDGMKTLCLNLKNNNSIEILSLNNNHLHDNALIYLIDFATRNRKLINIDIIENPMFNVENKIKLKLLVANNEREQRSNDLSHIAHKGALAIHILKVFQMPSDVVKIIIAELFLREKSSYAAQIEADFTEKLIRAQNIFRIYDFRR